jgi:hypothetical protein
MEIMILCIVSFVAGMGTERIRERKHRRLLKRDRQRYELW